MRKSLEPYRIPVTLDEPERWLFWTVDEALSMLGPVLFGFATGYGGIGLLVGICLFLMWRKLKGSRHMNVAIYGVYWFLPDALSSMRATPSSANRIYL